MSKTDITIIIITSFTLIVTSISTFFVWQTLIATNQSLYIANESLESTRESLNLTKNSLDLTKDSLEVNKKTLSETIESGSYNKKRQIYSITKYNCEDVVEHGLRLEENKLMALDFITEPYIEDMAFIYENFGEEAVKTITENLNEMFLANNYIYTLRELNIIAGAESDPQTLELIREQAENHNRWIGEHSQKIKNDFYYWKCFISSILVCCESNNCKHEYKWA